MRLYSDRLDCFLSGALVLTLARGTRRPKRTRPDVIDYRHFIDALEAQAPGVQGAGVPRRAVPARGVPPDLGAARAPKLTQRQACQTIVALLEMAARDGVRRRCWRRSGCDALLAAGELPDVKRLREEFAPRKTRSCRS